MKILIAILSILMTSYCFGEENDGRPPHEERLYTRYKESNHRAERDDIPYLRWKKANIERYRYEKLCRERQRERKSYEDVPKPEVVSEAYASEPQPESVLCDKDGNLSWGRNFLTYFFWPVLIGVLISIFFRVGAWPLGLAGFAYLIYYIHGVTSQVGEIGFIVWIVGIAVLCAVLRVILALLI
jgi:hypothetical protein